ncbi:MAG: proteasome accessory factor PafA2 family protein [Thaumarchaeota archaeon]|nr:proteasome accessory factor PafA2 family protein [Nitrososphaerota archaeon]
MKQKTHREANGAFNQFVPTRIGGLETEVALQVPRLTNESTTEYQARTVNLIKRFVALYKENNDIKWSYRYPVELWKFDAENRIVMNGSRLYSDHYYVEYSTAECEDPRTLIAVDRAGELILADLLRLFHETVNKKAVLLKNNLSFLSSMKPFTYSFSCHEDYSVSPHLFDAICNQNFSIQSAIWLSYLATRIILTGAGRVGPSLPHEFAPIYGRQAMMQLAEESNGSFEYLSARMKLLRRQIKDVSVDFGSIVPFEISARSSSITCLRSHETMEFRPLINLRDEPHADPYFVKRLHVIVGDSNRAELSTYLKFGCAQLVLLFLETSIPENPIILDNPLLAMKLISRDPTLQTSVPILKGGSMNAIQYQYWLCDEIEDTLNQQKLHLPAWGPAVLQEWRKSLDNLVTDPLMMRDKLDWVAKYALLKDHFPTGFESTNQTAMKLDLIYHKIGPDDYYTELVHAGKMIKIVNDDMVNSFKTTPPHTRARRRMEIIKEGSIKEANWNYLVRKDGKEFWLQDPAN